MKARPVNSSRFWSAAAVGLLVASAATAQGHAGPDVAGAEERAERPSPSNLTTLVRSLSSPEWAARQHAEDTLRHTLVDLTMLETVLSEVDHELCQEARCRLLQLGEEVFLRSPRPGVGISFSTRNTQGDGVRIETTVPGFDAAEHLKTGDIIISFGGIPTPDEAQMRTAIMVHDPEDVVELAVRRNGEVVNLRLRLGWFRDLDSARSPDRGAMRRAWAVRAARSMGSDQNGDAATFDLKQSLWQGADVVTNQARAQLQQRRRPNAVMVPKVALAGQPDEVQRMAINGRRPDTLDNRREMFLQQIDARIESMTERIQSLEARLARNGEDEQLAASAQQELQELRRMRQELLTLRDFDANRP